MQKKETRKTIRKDKNVLKASPAMGIYKRKQESKKTRNYAFDQESGQEKKKKIRPRTRKRPRKKKIRKQKNMKMISHLKNTTNKPTNMRNETYLHNVKTASERERERRKRDRERERERRRELEKRDK